VRDRFPLVALAALIFAVGSGALLVRTARRGAFAEPLSTYRSSPDGARALYLLAARSGLRVSRRHLDLADLPTAEDRPGLLVLLGVEALARRDAQELQRFVTEGGALLLVAPAAAADRAKGKEDAPADGKKKGLLESLGDMTRRPIFDAFALDLTPSESAVAERDLEVGVPSPLVAGVEMAQARVASYVERRESARELPLLVDPHGGGRRVAIAFAHGAGRVAAVSSGDLATNRALGRADNARFWLSMLEALADGKRIEFDEYPHGFTGERSISGYAARYGLHWGVLQLCAALFAWVAALQRFGPQRRIAGDERAASADYLLAMARIYRRGGHRAHAARLLVAGVLRSLGRHAGAPPGASAPEIASALERRGRGDLAHSLRALQEREGSASHGDGALLSLARACAEVRAQAASRAGPGEHRRWFSPPRAAGPRGPTRRSFR
jgi:hypothetical protein